MASAFPRPRRSPRALRKIHSQPQHSHQANGVVFWGTVSLVVAAAVGLTLKAPQQAIADSLVLEALEPLDGAATTPILERDATSPHFASASYPSHEPAAVNPWLLSVRPSTTAPNSSPAPRFTQGPSATTPVRPAPAPAATLGPAAAPSRTSPHLGASTPTSPLVSAGSTAVNLEAPQARIERLQTQLRGSEEAQRARAYLQSLREESPQVSQR